MQQMVAKHSFHFGTEFNVTLAHQEQLHIGNTQDSSGGKIGGVAVPRGGFVHCGHAQRVEQW